MWRLRAGVQARQGPKVMMSEEQVTGWQAKIHVQDTTELSSEVDLRGLAEGARQTGLLSAWPSFAEPMERSPGHFSYQSHASWSEPPQEPVWSLERVSVPTYT